MLHRPSSVPGSTSSHLIWQSAAQASTCKCARRWVLQVGSCEGRMAVQHVDDAHATKNFTFKCHRDGNDVYPVNSMAFHPQYGTFCSAGSDGTFNFWVSL